ncbi:non-ribosomal peptide synthetase [Streptoalloteichus hindustanus]|uniref:Nonribosomal peptide synthetase protein BlmVI n=1 Tax=Streptoalloteichus hindustanus TaxID=2017 RepID=A0A1M5F3M7_STRHI|nr:non-ribosomal peptide synthetase [Streptoalloteichus hindustanus]SHF85811.1 nonribosomal peptide synthetase protein BlmVI [Streptoalloteichus hindustanus]
MTSTRARSARTIVDVARHHAETTPSRPAYVFLPDGETESERFDFAGIDLRARAIAVALRERGMVGERVLIAYPSGSAYVQAILGCLYAGAIAVPCDAPERASSVERLTAVAGDAAPALTLAAADGPLAGRMPLFDITTVSDEAAESWSAPALDVDAPAFLQYTSGSTRTPRGVMVSHANLLANEEAIRRTCGHDQDSTFVGWLPLFHDMGLVANVLQPLFLGSLSVLMPPSAVLRHPIRWLRAVTRYRAHTSGGPNFGYELCVERTSPEERAELDLSSWLVAYNGAEPVRAATLRRFAEVFTPHGFASTAHFPCYGLAEATLLVSGTPKAEAPLVLTVDPAELRQGRVTPAVEPAPGTGSVGTGSLGTGSLGTELVSCGKVAVDTEVRVVDPETARPVADGQVGEVWVRGPGVSGGYWRDPDESDTVMHARLGEEGPYLRTGDLGCLLDGQLYLTGRRKDLLVVRGQNHYPHDLEWTAEQAHPALRPSCGAAFAVDDGDRERLVLCYELRAPVSDLADVAEAVRRELSRRHGVEPHELVFLERGGVPKTTSGKVRRQSCRQSYVDGKLPVLAVVPLAVGDARSDMALPSLADLAELDPAQRVLVLASALRDALIARAGVAGAPPALDEPLSAMGVDSLALMELGHHVEACYGVVLGPGVLLGDTGVREVAQRILDAAEEVSESSAPTPPVADPTWLPLTGGQRALWFEQALAPESGAYHLARAMRIEGRLDVAAFTRAFDRLVARHAALRTRFAVHDGQPVCRVDDEGPRLVITEAGPAEDSALTRQLATLADEPFDLLAGPPVRAVLFRRDAEASVLFLMVHHLLADFWSFVVVMRDLAALYREETGGDAADLPPPRVGHADLVRAENLAADSPSAERQIRFWRETLAEAPAALDLPTERPEPTRRTFEGATQTFRVPAELTDRLRDLARAERCTLFTTLLTGYQLLLHRYAAQQDIVVGTLLARRERAELANLVGYLVNPLPIRSRFEATEPFRALLLRTRRSIVDAMEHADVPFDRLVGEVAPVRLPGRAPLVQSLFVMQREYGPAADGFRALALGVPGKLPLGDLAVETVPVPRRWAQLDLTLSMAEVDGELVGVWEYRTDVLAEPAVSAMTRHFLRLLSEAVAEPDQPAGNLDLLSTEERGEVRRGATGPERPRDGASLHDLVARAAAQRPDAVAVIADDASGVPVQISYRALQRAATRIAARLGERGVQPEEPVALLVERGSALPLGYLGVLNAGAVVLPLNPEDPDHRLSTVLADSGARTVLTQRSLVDRAGGLGAHAVAVEDLLTADGDGHTRGIHPEQAAYLLYTSGSTGKPKGVLVPQRGIVNRILWMQEEYQLGPGERVLHKTPVTFDVSLWELFWPLVAGGCLVIARPGGHRDPAYLHALIARHQVSTAHFVPSMLGPFVAERARGEALPSLRRVVCSGEVLSPELCRRFAALFDAELHNLYGPTEASVDVTAWRCSARETGAVPIGHPIANTTCVVLDERLRVLPAGVTGELHLGGVGLARGYLNRPELTATSFVPDPDGTGERLYRSGDLARSRANGVLEYRGRRDDQTKIAGNRVEPGEVAEVLRGQPEITDAAVVARDQRLVGYVVADRPVSAEALRARLRDLLPAFLVPAAIVQLDQLPLTSSGKLDARALPVPVERAADSEPPRGDTEHRLAEIWREQLGVSGLGVTDDYFTLGGDSIRAIRVVSAARDAGLDLTVTDLLHHRTVRDLAHYLDRRAEPRPDTVDASEVVPPFALCPAAAGREGVADAYPISMAQRALLFHRENNPGYEVYVTSVAVHGPLDRERMAEAVAGVMRRHAYLRSFFDLTSYDEPVQLVMADVPTPLHVIDVRDLPATERQTAFQRWLHAERQRHFDVDHGPLVRFTAHDAGTEFRLTVSSFGLDGWCVAIVLTELLRHHREGAAGHATHEAEHVGYADFVALERQAMSSEEHRRFWTTELSGAEECLLPRSPGFPRKRTAEARQHRHVVEVDADVHAKLTDLAATLGVGLKHVLLAAHLRVVRTWTGHSDTVTGLECNGRPERRGGDRVVGVFNNIVPLRLNTSEPRSWAELARAAHAAEVRLSPFRRYPLAQLHREHGAGRLFDTLFVFTHFHLYEELAEAGVSDLQAPDQTYVPLTAHFNLDAWSGRLRLLLDFDPAELAEDQIAALADSYSRAVEAMATEPERHPAATALAEASADADGGSGFAWPDSVADLVHDTVRRTPDHVALSEGSRHLSYAGLWSRAGALAAALRSVGVGPESVVGLFAPRRLDTVVAMVAILRAGGAYLPLDPTSPPHRLRQLLTESGASVVVLPPSTAQQAQPEWAEGMTVVHADARTETRSPVRRTHRDALACVMPTSGSTGVPKLVGVPHRGMVNYLRWAVERYGIDARTVAPVASSPAFDLTVTSLLAPLVGGGTAELLPADAPTTLGDALARGRHTLVKLTPAHLAAVAEQLAAHGGRSSLRTVVVGGEQLHAGHVRALWTVAPEAVVVNEYGPTETVVGCSVHQVTDLPSEGPVPIGRAISGASVRAVDEYASGFGATEAAPGVLGELHVGGAGVTRGYLGRPADTAAAFVPDPHREGARRYRTGDLARRLPHGELVFVGRADRQVKIRGHRVELGELEHTLAAHPAVRQVAAVTRPGPGGRLRLTAYWVSAPGTEAATAELQDWLAHRLPAHLVPDALVRMPALPMTANGKVDQSRLPDGADRVAAVLERIEELSDAEVERLLANARTAAGPSPTEGGARG